MQLKAIQVNSKRLCIVDPRILRKMASMTEWEFMFDHFFTEYIMISISIRTFLKILILIRTFWVIKPFLNEILEFVMFLWWNINIDFWYIGIFLNIYIILILILNFEIIDIDKDKLKNIKIDIEMTILENIDKGILQNNDIDRQLYQ